MKEVCINVAGHSGMISQRSGESFTAHISYLEIYNEILYDLLDVNHTGTELEDLPYVAKSAAHVTTAVNQSNLQTCFSARRRQRRIAVRQLEQTSSKQRGRWYLQVLF